MALVNCLQSKNIWVHEWERKRNRKSTPTPIPTKKTKITKKLNREIDKEIEELFHVYREKNIVRNAFKLMAT